MTTLKISGIVGGILLLGLIAGHLGGNSKSTAATSSATSAHIIMLHGRRSDNSCIENDSDRRVYVMFTLRNTGDQAGTVSPWATFNYSDGGHEQDYYDNYYSQDLTVPAHTDVDATFSHPFDPQLHSVIRCAGYRDLTDTTGWYLPIHNH